MTTVSMIYGVYQRGTGWILPWLISCAFIIVCCTAYAVLWWSGDVFNEQLTMSVTEFVASLAINGPCFIIVLMYYLRLTGRLTSDKPRNYLPSDMPSWSSSHSTPPDLPPWRRKWPEEPPFHLERKLRRRERSRSPLRSVGSPTQAPRRILSQREYAHWDTAENRTRSSSSPLTTGQQRVVAGWTGTSQRTSRSRTPPTRRSSVVPFHQLESSPKTKPQRTEPMPYGQSFANRSLLRSSSRPTTPKRRSPQRVSFKSRPKVYERTPESSLSGNERREMQTVV
jgi:hypothetical protein